MTKVKQSGRDKVENFQFAVLTVDGNDSHAIATVAMTIIEMITSRVDKESLMLHEM